MQSFKQKKKMGKNKIKTALFGLGRIGQMHANNLRKNSEFDLKYVIDLNKNYYWVVYPKNKNTQNLHLQVAGIWDPVQLNDLPKNSSKINFSKLLEELDLKDNYFSVRGELVFVNKSKKEIVIKICSTSKLKNLKNKNFKLVIKGELSLELLNNFVSLDVNRDGNSLKLLNYEVIEKNFSKNN